MCFCLFIKRPYSYRGENSYYRGPTEKLNSVNSFAISVDEKKGIARSRKLKKQIQMFDGKYRKNDKFDRKTWEKCS
jgi:hypothetical protein